MITIEMIQNGFQNGSISIENEFNGCIGLCCRIADNAFYFETDNKAMYFTKEKYLQAYTMDEIIGKLYDVLQDVEHAEVYGLDCEELKYYELVLDDSRNEI